MLEVGKPSSDDIYNDSSKTGETVSEALDDSGGSTSDDILNNSTVPGVTVTDALNALAGGGGTIELTDAFYVDGTTGDDLVATGNMDKPFKTIQACLNFIGQPITKADYMRHIDIYLSDALTALPGITPGNSWNGVYQEDLVVPNRSITFHGKGVKIGTNVYGSLPNYGNILKEYSSSRRFGCSSSDFRPCLTFMGDLECRDTHLRLRNGFYVSGRIRTSILKRNLSSIQGDGVNHITVEVAAGQFTYPITVPTTYPTDPYIRIKVEGTTNYNGVYDVTSKIDNTHFIATRVSGTNPATGVEISGYFFESDSAGASGLSHDSAYYNTYVSDAITCDDGVVNGSAPTAGTEVMYSFGSKFMSIEGRTILLQRVNETYFASTIIVNSMASIDYSYFADNITLSTFTYSTDDMGFTSCKFASGKTFTVSSAGQTIRMDYQTYSSFFANCSWVTNTPSIAILGTFSGTTVQRPATISTKGLVYFDTTLGKPIFSNGAGVWVDATGAGV